MASEKNNESRLPPESQPWGRDVDESIADIRRLVTRMASDIAAVPKTISDTFSGINITRSASTTAKGMALSTGWTTYAKLSISVPSGKLNATLIAIGNMSFLDVSSGGFATVSGRIVINGAAQQEVPSAKDAGASVVVNVLTPMGQAALALQDGQTIEIELQAIPSNGGNTFPANANNFAAITAIVVFNN